MINLINHPYLKVRLLKTFLNVLKRINNRVAVDMFTWDCDAVMACLGCMILNDLKIQSTPSKKCNESDKKRLFSNL